MLYFSLFMLYFFLFLGNIILHATLVMEIVGRRQNTRADDGPRYWNLFGHRKEAEEETHVRLPMGEFEIPQLVGVQVLPL